MPEEFVELEGELAAGVGPDPAARHSGRAWWLRVAAPQVVQTYRAVPSSGQARKSQVSAGGQRGGAGSSQRIPSGEDEVDVFAQGRGGVGAIAGSGEVGTELVALALGWLRGGITGLTGEGDEAGGLRGGGDLVAEEPAGEASGLLGTRGRAACLLPDRVGDVEIRASRVRVVLGAVLLPDKPALVSRDRRVRSDGGHCHTMVAGRRGPRRRVTAWSLPEERTVCCHKAGGGGCWEQCWLGQCPPEAPAGSRSRRGGSRRCKGSGGAAALDRAVAGAESRRCADGEEAGKGSAGRGGALHLWRWRTTVGADEADREEAARKGLSRRVLAVEARGLFPAVVVLGAKHTRNSPSLSEGARYHLEREVGFRPRFSNLLSPGGL